MESLGAWLKRQRPARGSVRATVLHHTWAPTAAQFAGRSTIEAVRRYHMGTLGWRDIGANLYAAPDGVYTARPLSDSNWSHAALPSTMSWSQVEAEACAVMGGNRNWMNYYALGLESVANWDTEDPFGTGPAAQTYQNAIRTLAVVHTVFDIPVNRLFFHRDVAYKSCPGNLLARAKVRTDVARILEGTMSDVSEWAKPAVERVIAAGLMTGYPDGTFRGRSPVTREELAVIIERVIADMKRMVDEGKL